MTKLTLGHAAALAFMLCLGSAAAAQASETQGQQDAQDAQAVATSKVTLPQAIATAERQSGGHAVSADFAKDGAATRIAVETAGPNGTSTVLIDPQTGTVVGTRAPSGDSDTD